MRPPSTALYACHQLSRRLMPVCLSLCLVWMGIARSNSQVFKTLYTFTGGADGRLPSGGLVQDAAGNLYGMTIRGGMTSTTWPAGAGVVYKLDTLGNFKVLYTFTGGADGSHPLGGPALDSAGNLYGTTFRGGIATDAFPTGAGVVFKLDTSSHFSVLHAFTAAPDGALPAGNLIVDKKGNLYGTAVYGGQVSADNTSGAGVVYKIDKLGKFSILHAFNGASEGAQPYAGLTLDAATGNLFGTTFIGGAAPAYGGFGVVYKISPTGQETVLHTFGGPEGSGPTSTLLRSADGTLFGTTAGIGGGDYDGVVYRIATDQSYTVLYKFGGGTDGSSPGGVLGPNCNLTLDSKGNLCGSTWIGGIGYEFSGHGTLFALDTSYRESVRYAFTGGLDGSEAVGSLLMDKQGRFYGVTISGGHAIPDQPGGCGVIYQWTPKPTAGAGPAGIMDLIACPGSATSSINWTTAALTNSVVQYGLTAGYGNTMTLPSLVASHTVGLSGLAPSTLYHFRVKSTDARGRTTTSNDHSFATGPTSQALLTVDHTTIKREAGGGYSVDVYLVNSGAAGIPTVELDKVALGAADASSPTLPASTVLPGSSFYRVTFVFPASSGATGQSVILSVNGKTLDAGANVTGYFTTNFLALALP